MRPILTLPFNNAKICVQISKTNFDNISVKKKENSRAPLNILGDHMLGTAGLHDRIKGKTVEQQQHKSNMFTVLRHWINHMDAM